MTASPAPAIAFAIAGFLSSATARADTLSKEQCIDAHSRGQDAREQGKLSLARKLFMSCAQPSCPALVQGDCARFTDDLMRQQSSLSFVARDAQGADLPDTAVYVDGNLIVTRLDDGRPHDVDPGSHSVRFTSNGIDQIVTLVVGTGEKSRVVSVTFPTINPRRPRGDRPSPAETAAASAGGQTTTHPTGSRYLVGTGGALVLTGAVLGVLGVRKVPSSCSISTNQCLAPQGDPAFDQARSGMQLVNAGLVVGTVGVATLAGGLVWYFTRARTERRADAAIVPSVAPDAAGLAVRGRF